MCLRLFYRFNTCIQGSYDSMSSYDSYNNTNGNATYGTQGLNTSTGRLGPNVPDDLKSSGAPARSHDPYRFTRSTAQPIPGHDSQTRTDYAKYRYDFMSRHRV